MKPIPVWLDCDPGHDDAFAILLALAGPWWDLIGISTVHGNSSLPHTTHNALALLTAYKQTNIKVYPGAAKSMDGHYVSAPSIHGESGLEGTNLLPEPIIGAESSGSAVAAMKAAIDKHGGELAIIATGALTNIGDLIRSCTKSQLMDIRYVSLMGGAIGFGNWSKYAEFNIWADVQAAELLFSNDILRSKTIVVPLNITHRALVTEDLSAKIRGDGKSTVRQMLFELIEFFRSTYEKEFNFEQGPPLHDPIAVYVLLYFMRETGMDVPEIQLEFSRNTIDIVQNGPRKGQMNLLDNPEGAFVTFNTSFEKFWEILLDSIEKVA